MSLAYRVRFGLAHDPMPRDASGKTCFVDSDDAAAVARHFDWLAAEPGLGLLTGDAGLGKAMLLRQLCDALPAPEHKTNYILHLRHRGHACRRLPKPRGRPRPRLILDEVEHLGDDFFVDFSGFLNFAFDRQTLLTVWLCGLPSLRTRLDLQHHKPLRDRIFAPRHCEPRRATSCSPWLPMA